MALVTLKLSLQTVSTLKVLGMQAQECTAGPVKEVAGAASQDRCFLVRLAFPKEAA